MSAFNRVVGLACLIAMLIPLGACNEKQRRFASPEEAAAAFTQAAERFDRKALVEMLGSKGKPLIFSKDSVQDRQRALAFASEAHIQHRIEMDSTGTVATLVVGPTDWPLPFPIVKDSSSWRFDTE